MGIDSSEAGHDDCRLVGYIVTIGVLEEQQVWCIGYPNAPVSDGDSRRDIETFGKNLHAIDFSIAIGVGEDFDAIFAWPGFMARVFKTFGDIDAACVIEGHGHGVLQVGFRGDEFDMEPFGYDHTGQGFGRTQRRSGRHRLFPGDEILGCHAAGRGSEPEYHQPEVREPSMPVPSMPVRSNISI